ncbi:hypothetical protein [Streptomyces cinnabarinus]
MNDGRDGQGPNGAESDDLDLRGTAEADADGAGLDGLGSDGLGLDGRGADRAGLDGLGLDGLDLHGLGSDEPGADGPGLGGLGLDGRGLDGLDRLRAEVEGSGEPDARGAGGRGAARWGSDQRARRDQRDARETAATPGAGVAAAAGLGMEELDLRQLLRDAVQEIEPRDGTLEHLRRAVPARRARKRQALVGMAAAALFVGTAVPALVHVSNTTGPGANPSVAGHGTQAQGGASQGVDPDNGESSSGGSSGTTEDQGPENEQQENDGKDNGGGNGSGGSADPAATADTGAAVCTAEQLAVAAAGADAPDAVGAVYGTFRFTNSSLTACTVTNPGSLNLVPGGAADATKLSTARHISGDPAASLPDPSVELTSLLLQPGSAYEVKFAWVPSETCPTTGENSGGTTGGEPSPDPTPSDSTGTTGGTSTGADAGTSTQLLTADGTVDGTVTVTNTAEPGAPTAQTTISGACAGTVYWTGVLAGA